MASEPSMLCAECMRCGRRSILGRALPEIAEPATPSSGRLRCDMCGGRRVRVVQTDNPMQLVAFIAGRG